MLRVEYRKMYRPNGLMDDFVLYGEPVDYVAFAAAVETAIESGEVKALETASSIHIEIRTVDGRDALFTSLQNQEDFYPSATDWDQRNILRVAGSRATLQRLRHFLVDLSGRGEGYSYISEYSEDHGYSANSPEWRLHVIHA
jgi:hypothetical protein